MLHMHEIQLAGKNLRLQFSSLKESESNHELSGHLTELPFQLTVIIMDPSGLRLGFVQCNQV